MSLKIWGRFAVASSIAPPPSCVSSLIHASLKPARHPCTPPPNSHTLMPLFTSAALPLAFAGRRDKDSEREAEVSIEPPRMMEKRWSQQRRPPAEAKAPSGGGGDGGAPRASARMQLRPRRMTTLAQRHRARTTEAAGTASLQAEGRAQPETVRFAPPGRESIGNPLHLENVEDVDFDEEEGIELGSGGGSGGLAAGAEAGAGAGAGAAGTAMVTTMPSPPSAINFSRPTNRTFDKAKVERESAGMRPSEGSGHGRSARSLTMAQAELTQETL